MYGQVAGTIFFLLLICSLPENETLYCVMNSISERFPIASNHINESV